MVFFIINVIFLFTFKKIVNLIKSLTLLVQSWFVYLIFFLPWNYSVRILKFPGYFGVKLTDNIHIIFGLCWFVFGKNFSERNFVASTLSNVAINNFYVLLWTLLFVIIFPELVSLFSFCLNYTYILLLCYNNWFIILPTLKFYIYTFFLYKWFF